jgi:hypothetical protein
MVFETAAWHFATCIAAFAAFTAIGVDFQPKMPRRPLFQA